MDSDSTFVGCAPVAATVLPEVLQAPRSHTADGSGGGGGGDGAGVTHRSETAVRVLAVITRRARAAGLTDAAYFAEIIAGRAPRITRVEASNEPLPPAHRTAATQTAAPQTAAPQTVAAETQRRDQTHA